MFVIAAQIVEPQFDRSHLYGDLTALETAACPWAVAAAMTAQTRLPEEAGHVASGKSRFYHEGIKRVKPVLTAP